MKIPWKNLYSMPVVVTIEDLYLLAVPNTSVSYNAEKQSKADLDAKRAELLKLDEIRQQELKKGKESDEALANKSFTEKLVAQIINNVQIRITNVHIRYEETGAASVPFAFGITLGSFEVHTTDADWKQTFLAEALSRVFKVAKLDGLAVYMNVNKTMFQSKSVDFYDGMFHDNIARQEQQPEGYSYGKDGCVYFAQDTNFTEFVFFVSVLGPINALAKLKLHISPELERPPFVTPKIDLSLEMQKLAIGITRAQYQRLVELADNFGAMTRGLPYRQFRPQQTRKWRI